MRIINVLVALIIAVGLFLPFNTPVQAATVNLAITGEGSLTQGSYVGGAGTWANLNSDDEATSYWQGGGGGPTSLNHTFNMDDFVAAYATIDSVTIYYRGFGHAVCSLTPLTYIGSTVYSGTSSGSLHTPPSGSYSYTWSVNPSSGSAWTSATLNAAEFGLNAYNGSSPGAWPPPTPASSSYMYVVVTYTHPSIPIITTQAASVITPTTATGNGNITSNGGSAITEKGICYKVGTTGDPTTADSTVHDHIDTTGAYTEAMVGLTKGTAYRLRAYAINAIGTGYGTTVDLVTIDDPTISTIAASLVTSTTARLNSQVTFDGAVGGGEACTVTFAYIISTSAHASYDDCAAAPGVEVTVSVPTATYILNQTPYLDITGLTAGATYYFATRIYNSTGLAANTHGAVLSFTTSTGISDTTGLTAIPTATTVSLAWVKGLGAGYTLVRYSASGYPATVADGTLAYLGVGNSYMLTGLTAGTTYYFSAWGKTGALYASGYATAMATTLAFDTATSTGTLETPPTNTWWNQTPSTTKVSNIPLASGLISANATAYGIPESSLWYFLWILFSVGTGVFIWAKSGNNLPMSLGAQALLFALGAVLGLVMLWIMVLFMIIGAGFTLWGDRR
jgi:hypothetical protein